MQSSHFWRGICNAIEPFKIGCSLYRQGWKYNLLERSYGTTPQQAFSILLYASNRDCSVASQIERKRWATKQQGSAVTQLIHRTEKSIRQSPYQLFLWCHGCGGGGALEIGQSNNHNLPRPCINIFLINYISLGPSTASPAQNILTLSCILYIILEF